MKDDNNVFFEVVYDLDTNKSKYRKTQIEDYDKNILCEGCDNAILGGKYERYSERILYGNNLPEDIAPDCTNYQNPDDGLEFSICHGINYKKIKLFLLSLLWRASITDRPYFEEVNLGLKHEERIRRIILEDKDIPWNEYPIIITSFMRTDNPLDALIAQPMRIKTKSGLNGYIFLLNGLQFIIYVNSVDHKLPLSFQKMCLKEDELVVLHLKDGQEREFIKMLMR